MTELPVAVSAGRASPARVRRRHGYSALAQLRRELNELYRENLSRRATRGGQVGRKTERERRTVIEPALEALHASGFKLRSIWNLRGKHVRQIIASWRARGLAASTLSSYVSILRTLCRWLHKRQLLDLIDEIVAAEPQMVRRRTVTDTDRSQQGKGIPVEEILDRALAADDRFACCLALIVAFGLRAAEAWLFRPHLALQPDGGVHIDWGTKGGRPRGLRQPLTDKHRELIVWAQSFAQTKAESMIPRGYTVQRWRRRFYSLCVRIGLTRRGLGVPAHALRHGALLDLYEWLTGHPAPARGGRLAQLDPHLDRAARGIVAAHAGHADVYITSHYLGPMRPRGSSS